LALVFHYDPDFDEDDDIEDDDEDVGEDDRTKLKLDGATEFSELKLIGQSTVRSDFIMYGVDTKHVDAQVEFVLRCFRYNGFYPLKMWEGGGGGGDQRTLRERNEQK
jgi:hypothetical protein